CCPKKRDHLRPLSLPLLPEVAHALSAYLRDGRPSSTNRVIFLRHCAPFEPFAKENNLNAIMRKRLGLAGLNDRSGRRGIYLLRHTLATQLLASGRPLKTISDLLGHASTQTTYVYTKVDLVGLRDVGISEEEVNQLAPFRQVPASDSSRHWPLNLSDSSHSNVPWAIAIEKKAVHCASWLAFCASGC